MGKWKLVNTIDTDDIVLDYFCGTEKIFLRLNTSIICVSKESFKIEWEHNIKFSSPIGYYKLYVTKDVLVYLSVDFDSDQVVYTGIDFKGTPKFEVKDSLRPYSEGIVVDDVTGNLLILSFNSDSRFLVEIDVKDGQIINKQEVKVAVFHLVQFQNDTYIGGVDGLFVVNSKIEYLSKDNVVKFFKTETELYFLNETDEIDKFELQNILKGKKTNKIDNLIIDSSEKQFIERSKINNDCLYFSSSDYGGLQCYSISNRKELWCLGKSKYSLNSITFNKSNVIILIETPDADVELLNVENGLDKKIEEIESEVMPETIYAFNDNLIISGLMGIELYKKV